MKSLAVVLGVLWMTGVLGGGFSLCRHRWAEGTPDVKAPQKISNHAKAKYRLLLFLHPQCECSHATVAELARILTAAHGTVEAQLYFFRPRNQTDAWCKTKLWDEAAQLHGALLQEDLDGAKAKAFGAHTSGQALLYREDGQLVFSGGITDGRGHEGPNDGEDAIMTLLETGSTRLSSTPVFGCIID